MAYTVTFEIDQFSTLWKKVKDKEGNFVYTDSDIPNATTVEGGLIDLSFSSLEKQVYTYLKLIYNGDTSIPYSKIERYINVGIAYINLYDLDGTQIGSSYRYGYDDLTKIPISQDTKIKLYLGAASRVPTYSPSSLLLNQSASSWTNEEGTIELSSASNLNSATIAETLSWTINYVTTYSTRTLYPADNSEQGITLKVTSVTPSLVSTAAYSSGVQTATKLNDTLVWIDVLSGSNVPIDIVYDSTIMSNANQMTVECYTDAYLNNKYNEGLSASWLTLVRSTTEKKITFTICETGERIISKELYYVFKHNEQPLLKIRLSIRDVQYIIAKPLEHGEFINVSGTNIIQSYIKPAISVYNTYNYSPNTLYSKTIGIDLNKKYIIFPVICRSEYSEYGRMAIVVLYDSSIWTAIKDTSLGNNRTHALYLQKDNEFVAIAPAVIPGATPATLTETLKVVSDKYTNPITLKVKNSSATELLSLMTDDATVRNYIKD